MLPIGWQQMTFKLDYSIIYISAFFSLEKRGRWVLTLFLIAFLLEWISAILNLSFVHYVSRILKVLFFLFVIVRLIRQIATARDINIGVVLGAITGYLLLGLIYSIFVSIVILNDPGSYTNLLDAESMIKHIETNTSFPLYYSFVTITSLGYGDIVPLTPVSRSLATFIVVTGQLYIATIIALMVGKFSAIQSSNKL